MIFHLSKKMELLIPLAIPAQNQKGKKIKAKIRKVPKIYQIIRNAQLAYLMTNETNNSNALKPSTPK